MSLAEQYRRKAEDAAAGANAADNPFSQRMHKKIAAHWHELAHRVDRQETAGADAMSSIAPTVEREVDRKREPETVRGLV